MMEVPAQIKYEQQTVNSVVVSGGSNWDLSRSAVTTPISPIVGAGGSSGMGGMTLYAPQHRMPNEPPYMVLTFSKNAAILNRSSLGKLNALPRKSRIVLAAHADPEESSADSLSRRRLENVAAQLRKKGHSVEVTRHFGALLPLTDDPFHLEMNRRVELFVR